MLRRILLLVVLAGILVGAGLFYVTLPKKLPDEIWAGLPAGDAAKGEQVFWMGGCASCHAAPGEGSDPLVLAGGLPIVSEFGTFHVPNISPDATHGIGDWTLADFGNALKAGVSPGGQHFYPSFPYSSYVRMTPEEVNDLFAFMKTLPADDTPSKPHDVGFPFNMRLLLGGWKLLFFSGAPRVAVDTDDPMVARGQHIVEGPGHCGECHTPRNALGGFKADAWLAGAPNPDGEGSIPNITPGGEIGSWSASDIAYYLESGFTPDFDVVGGSMADVQKNMAKLPAEDREAIAAYLKAVPAREDGYTSGN